MSGLPIVFWLAIITNAVYGFGYPPVLSLGPERPPAILKASNGQCPNWICIDGKCKEEKYYFNTSLKANWYEAFQFCINYNMKLVSIESKEENDEIVKKIMDSAFRFEDFWTSGNDLAKKGKYVWMSTGKSVTYTNWSTGEPNNLIHANGEGEDCLELCNVHRKGIKWNDDSCSTKKYFVCEV